ncbi:hypothetical protein MCERE19_02510 [Spirosomataceae bacterium]
MVLRLIPAIKVWANKKRPIRFLKIRQIVTKCMTENLSIYG